MSDAAQQATQPADDSTLARLGELLAQLKNETAELVDSRLTLLAEEAKTAAAAYARDVAVLGAGGAAATVGLTLLHVRPARRTGAVYLALGAATAAFAVWRLRGRTPVPARAVAELKEDVRLLAQGLGELTD
jgi:hypothetical protein